MLARRVFVILFVLLQCLGPLLHAHAGSVGQGDARSGVHSGIHLPGLVPLVAAHGMEMHVQTAAETVAVTLASSLEARDKYPLAGGDAPVSYRPAALARIADPRRARPDTYATPAPPARHLLPQPCAPPRA